MQLSMDEVKRLAKLVVGENGRKHYNGIVKLVNGIDVSSGLQDEQVARFAVMSLFQIFKKLFARGELVASRTAGTSPDLQQFYTWCRKLYHSFKEKLLAAISELPYETSLALDSLDVYMQLLELESEYWASDANAAFFPNKTLQKLILAMWQSNHPDSPKNAIVVEFSEKYYQKFVDIQYYFQLEYSHFLQDDTHDIFSSTQSVNKWLIITNNDNIRLNPQTELEIYVSNAPNIIESESKFKSLFEKNWLSMLNANLSVPQFKAILLVLHKRIIPYFNTPTKLMDFLTDSYNLEVKASSDEGMIPILALNGLFELMRRFNLEYPNFYTKLYQKLTPELMHARYRARFFRLMDLFLSSTHLSANLVASFIKKLARLSLKSPPGAIVSIIPFIYNLLRRHPSCMIMLHNPSFIKDPFFTQEQLEQLALLKDNYSDPFNDLEVNPESTNAMGSSLWELATLMDHYHPNVASLAKIFAQPFRKLSYNMEDFLDWSYDSLMEAELKRNLKILPTLEFEEFDAFFEADSGVSKAYLSGVGW